MVKTYLFTGITWEHIYKYFYTMVVSFDCLLLFICRGEKAFCSTECRSSHIANDERKERCRSKFSTSPYTAGQIFSTGVLVT